MTYFSICLFLIEHFLSLFFFSDYPLLLKVPNMSLSHQILSPSGMSYVKYLFGIHCFLHILRSIKDDPGHLFKHP